MISAIFRMASFFQNLLTSLAFAAQFSRHKREPGSRQLLLEGNQM
jgi:hypothetical protein